MTTRDSARFFRLARWRRVAVERVRSWRRRREERRFIDELALMEDWRLDDIGLSRADVERARRTGRLWGKT